MPHSGCSALHGLNPNLKKNLMAKKWRQKFKYLENEKSFSGEIKSFFIMFKGLSVAKNCLRLESPSLIATFSSMI